MMSLLRSCSLLGLLLLASSAAGQPWTRFRGPNGDGISQATTIPVSWTADDFNWKTPLPGIGHSSPVVWGDRIFVTSAVEESAQRIVLCVQTGDGKILWERRFDSAVHPKHLRNSFASSTPAVDENHVYVCWSTPEQYLLVALDHDGKDAWKVDLGPYVSQHSCGTSPIVYGDTVILGNDQDGVSFLTALNCSDGQERWRTERRSAVVAYSTPCLRKPPGKPPELIFNSEAHGISGIDAATGKTNWELSVFDKRTVSSPIVADGLVFGTCGSGGGGSYVVALHPGSGPDEPPKTAYKVTDAAPYVPTPLAKGDLLFLWSDKGVVSCLKLETGESLWRERVGGNFSGSPVCVNNCLYCIADDGTVVVLAAADKFELLGRNALGEDSRSTPAIADNVMYLRTYSHLISLGGRK
jgi:outer membrane protein assembly factor BamB